MSTTGLGSPDQPRAVALEEDSNTVQNPANRIRNSHDSYYNRRSSSRTSQSQGRMPNRDLDQLSKTNLYIRGLNPDTTDQELIMMCQEFGKIVSTKAIIDPETNQCKGYGFVDFENPQDAEQAVQQLRQKNIIAQMAKQQEQDPTNLYIANLPSYVDETYLESMVSPYGDVVSVRILKDQNNSSRGVGFCRMESKETCERIIREMDKHLPNSTEPLVIKFADSSKRKRTRNPYYQYETVPHSPYRDSGEGIPLGMSYPVSAPPTSNTPQQFMAPHWTPGYPQIPMSPMNATIMSQSNVDPAMLANQFTRMQISNIPNQQNYGMHQGVPYQPMYQSHMAAPYQLEMSGTPPMPPYMNTGYDDQSYQSYGQ